MRIGADEIAASAVKITCGQYACKAYDLKLAPSDRCSCSYITLNMFARSSSTQTWPIVEVTVLNILSCRVYEICAQRIEALVGNYHAFYWLTCTVSLYLWG
jgi:hypothetical protein